MAMSKTKRRQPAVVVSEPAWKILRDFYLARWRAFQEGNN